MKKYMVKPKRVLAKVYDLEFLCPHCGKINSIYHFMDWNYKSRFWCQECKKVVYKPEEIKEWSKFD